MNSNIRNAAVLVVVALGAACNNNQSAIVPPSFDRPSRMALGCYDGVAGHFLPLADCADRDNESDENEEDALRHIALVLQTSRGEIGTVDLQAEEAIDSDPFIPGYTFIRVGELPSAIVLPERRPDVTFVASFGSRTVESIDTTRLIPGATRVNTTPLATNVIGLDAGATDLAYFEVGADDASPRFLFATLPETSQLLQIPVGPDGALGTPVALNLAATIPPYLAAGGGADALRVCPANEAVRSSDALARTPVALDVVSRPVRVKVVTGPTGSELLVADSALPIIHRYSLDATGATELLPISVAVPTTDFAVTPLVPVALEAAVATERYLYAIDAIDHSVLVVDFADTSPTFGQVLAVAAGSDDSDRIPLRVNVRTLEVAAPEYTLDGANTVTSDRCTVEDTDALKEDVVPGSLRGVFLMASGLDGNVHVVDVHDLDAACRGGAGAQNECTTPVNDNDVYVQIRRHRPRIGQLASEPPAVTSQPATSFDTSTTRLDDSGSPIGSDGPGLTAFVCPGAMSEQLRPAYPNEDAALTDPALICISRDPWISRTQVWRAQFEGQLPNATGGNGRLTTMLGGTHLVADDFDFCARGTLGTDDVTASALGANDPELGYAGDLLVITGELPPSTIDAPECAKFVIPENDTRDRIAFTIIEATPSVLRLGDVAPGGIATTFAEVASCFIEPTTYAIHARESFVVSSTFTLLRHRVIDNGGVCRVDAVTFPVDPNRPDTYRWNRAVPGRVFVAPEVAFQIRPPTETLTSGTSARIEFGVTQVPNRLAFDTGALVESMTFDPTGDVFYVVDSGSTGLVSYDLAPLTQLFSVF
jgi:hypothetical protein